MGKVPHIPRAPEPQVVPEREPDLRVRATRDEVLAGLDEQGLLYQSALKDFAIGPGSLRYSLRTLLELEADGVIAAHDSFGKIHTFREFPEYLKSITAGGGNTDDDGNEGNTFPSTLTWQRR